MLGESPQKFEGPVTPEYTKEELLSHKERALRRKDSPYLRALLRVIRGDVDLWSSIVPVLKRRKEFRKGTQFEGELHRQGAELFAGIYLNPEAAALYDLAIFDTTAAESKFYKEKIREGVNYAPVVVTGGGGVYGTIFSSALLKYKPEVPAFGVDQSRRRGGIWATSGDFFLDQEWWEMNSKNRPENRAYLPIPGGRGNLNSLGDFANLQLPDISTRQYATQNEYARVVAHDNLQSMGLRAGARFIKARKNRSPNQPGAVQLEYEDLDEKKRFYLYTDRAVQATGLGREDYGLEGLSRETRDFLDKENRKLEEGVETPNALTFFQLVEATTSNRTPFPRQEFKKFGLIGRGDTSKVIREYFVGAGVAGSKSAAQVDFIEEIVVFGEFDKVKEELLKDERCRYVRGLLEFQRADGGYFRIRGIEGRVRGLGEAKNGVSVIYERIDKTPEGEVKTMTSIVVPKLLFATGFIDESDKIYSGLTIERVTARGDIEQRLQEALATTGATLYVKKGIRSETLGQISRIDIGELVNTKEGRVADLTLIDIDGNTIKKELLLDNPEPEWKELLSPANVVELEFLGKPPKVEPLIDKEFDDEIPVAEKLEGFEVYKVGSATNQPISEKERRQTSAYQKVRENTKSVFRFSRTVQAFARKTARELKAARSGLQDLKFRQEQVVLPELRLNKELDFRTIPVDPKAAVQQLPEAVRTTNLLKYIVGSRLNMIFPKGLERIELLFKKIKKPAGGIEFKVRIDPPLPEEGPWKMADDMLRDSLMQRIMLRLSGQRTSDAGRIFIPLAEQKIALAEIEASSLKSADKRLAELSEV